MQLTACGHGCHASHHLLGCLSPRSSAASPSLPSRPLLRRSVAPRSPPVLPAPRRSRPPSSLYPGSCRPSRLGEPRRSSSRPCAPPCLRAGAWSGPGPLSLSVSLCLTSRPCSPPWGRRPLGSEAPSSPRPRPPSQPPEPALCAPACPALARSGPCLPAGPAASGRHTACPARAAAAPSLAWCCGRAPAAPPPWPGPTRAAPGPRSPLEGASASASGSVSLAGAAAAPSSFLLFFFSCAEPEPHAHQALTRTAGASAQHQNGQSGHPAPPLSQQHCHP